MQTQFLEEKEDFIDLKNENKALLTESRKM